MQTPTLYQRLLSKDFARLPPALREFHSRPGGGCASGIVTVERSHQVLRSTVAGVLRLPDAGENVPLKLEIIPQGEKELWIRDFENQRLETLQWLEGSYLIERIGSLHLVFKVTADEHGMIFQLQCNKVRGMKLPPGASFQVAARARGDEKCWNIEVHIAAPFVGQISSYRGVITPHSC